jgi:soluble lytic murein transglycosylase-like protein
MSRLVGVLLGFALSQASAADGTPPAEETGGKVREAVAYEYGEGVVKDPHRAAGLYCEAARQFDAEALYRLGWMYAYGRGVARDDAAAAGLLEQAAALGYEHAAQARSLLGAVDAKLPECLLAPALPASTLLTPDFAPMVRGPDPFALLPAWKREIAAVAGRLAQSYAIEPRLALAIITAESNFTSDALSAKGAAGLMQLTPETAARFNVKDRYDVSGNLRGGLAYLRWLLAYYRGQVALAAAAYNAGEDAVDKYGGIPPYAETRDYVRRVMGLYGSEEHPFDARLADPSPVVTRAGSAAP